VIGLDDLTTTVPCSNGTMRLEKLLTASNSCPLQWYIESCCSAAAPAATGSCPSLVLQANGFQLVLYAQ
jgi:hypothetical protein